MKQVKTIITAIAGLTVVFIGVALLVLPGPGLLLIAAGIGILALEFVWAKNLINKIKGTKGKG
jgi:tellurite resistance protein TerC